MNFKHCYVSTPLTQGGKKKDINIMKKKIKAIKRVKYNLQRQMRDIRNEK